MDLRSSTSSGVYKESMWTNVDFSWSFHLWKNIYVSARFPQVLFFLSFQSCFLLRFADWIVLDIAIHNCLLVQKIRNQKFSAIVKTSKVNFLLEVILFLWTKGFKHIFAFMLMHMCACLKERTREVIGHLLCPLCMVCQGSVVSWNRQGCNRQSMQRVQNTWSIGTCLCLNARTQM